MNKKVAIFITVIAIVEFLILLFFVFLILVSSHEIEGFVREKYDDERYSIRLDKIDDGFLWGPAEVKVKIYDNITKSYLASFDTYVNNQGNKLTEDNYKIEYTDDYIKIYLIDYDNSKQVYTFDIKDYESNQN